MDGTLVTSKTYRATKANKIQLSKIINIEVAGTVQQTTCKPLKHFINHECIPDSPATELALMFQAEKMSVKRFRLINNAEENNIDLRVYAQEGHADIPKNTDRITRKIFCMA